MLEQYDDVLTASDLARILSIGKNRIYEMLEKGTVKSIRIGNQWRIPKTAVIEYLSTCGYTQSMPVDPQPIKKK